MIERTDPKLILFDLGGVLLQLKDPIETFGLNWDEPEFHRNWLLSPSVRDHESGTIDAEQFAERITRELQLSYDAGAFLQKFTAWPGRPFPEALDLVRRIDEKYACAILSNTNSLHWHTLDIDTAFGNRFEYYFLSFETGLLKPDSKAFAHVVATCECTPDQVLFFDDNPLNIEAAANFGMQTVLCATSDDLAGALISRKLLT